MNQNQYSHQNYYPSYTTSSSTIGVQDPVLGPLTTDSISKLCDFFSDLDIGFPSYLSASQPQNQLRSDQIHQTHIQQQKTNKVPSGDYMCHVCFRKDHFIRDCPQVGVW